MLRSCRVGITNSQIASMIFYRLYWHLTGLVAQAYKLCTFQFCCKISPQTTRLLPLHYDQNTSIHYFIHFKTNISISPIFKFTSGTYPLGSSYLPSFPRDMNAAFDSLRPMKCSSTGHGSTLGCPNPSKLREPCSALNQNRFGTKRCGRSLLHSGRKVGAPRLDDLRPQGAGLVILVAVVGGRAVAALVLADVDDDAGGGGGGSVQLVLVPWS